MENIGGCAICRGHDFTKKGFDDKTVLICDQCENEYHIGCLRVHKKSDLKAVPKGKWFCCEHCKYINSVLKKYIKRGNNKICNVKKGDVDEVNIKWRLLKGRGATKAHEEYLSDVVFIFQDLFKPIADSTTASFDLIPHMVYGNSFKDKDYGGMHCAILMVNSVVVSAAIFRVFGEEVAEILLVATKRECQKKGYFPLLFGRIVALLSILNVKNVVLCTDETESFWKNKFSFKKLNWEQVQDYKRRYQHIMVFEGTSMLHRSIDIV